MDNKEFTKLVSSFVIGDGYLSNLKQYNKGNTYGQLAKRKNCQYSLKQLSIHRDYVEWQSDILEYLTKVTIKIVPKYTDKRGYFCKEKLELHTRRNPFYTTMRNNFYINSVKIINPHYLKLWDAQSLAILYMDDGWLEKQINQDETIYYRIGIATHSYSYGDNMLLKKMIKEKFAIEFDIKKHKQKSGEYKFFLRNSKNNTLRFIDLVYPYIFPSFQYKIDKTVQSTPDIQDEDIV